MSSPSKVIVLAEDERHQRFAWRYLRRSGLKTHEITMEPLPSGRGAGEHWVRKGYGKAVKAYRLRSAKAKTALVVAIDADTRAVEERQRQLRDILAEEALPPRTQNEAIAHLIPKRAIETWLLFLNGMPVDEDTDYRQNPGVADLIGDAAVAFFDLTRVDGLPANCVPSLAVALREIKRVL